MVSRFARRIVAREQPLGIRMAECVRPLGKNVWGQIRRLTARSPDSVCISLNGLGLQPRLSPVRKDASRSSQTSTLRNVQRLVRKGQSLGSHTFRVPNSGAVSVDSSPSKKSRYPQHSAGSCRRSFSGLKRRFLGGRGQPRG